MEGTRYCAAVVIDRSEPSEHEGMLNRPVYVMRVDTRQCQLCRDWRECGIYELFRIGHPADLVRKGSTEWKRGVMEQTHGTRAL